jgi:hypothetical protein
MSKAVKKVLLFALLLYIDSFAACLVGSELHPNPFPGLEDLRPWSTWDYVSCVLLLIAIGSTIAAVRFQGRDDD